MRRWRNLAAPNDPEAWYDVDGVWPTKRGTYETADFLSGTDIAAAAASAVTYAWCANTLTSRVEYVLDSSHIWEYAAGAYTDRTGGVSCGTPMMAAYGNIVIAVMGEGLATVKATAGGNFSALAGAPKGRIVLVVANAVLILHTDTSDDGWAASDVGDYTNWTTGEAASGRLIDTPGPIMAGVVFGGCAYAFKKDAIYRGRYVGGAVKWAWELVYQGVGVQSYVGTGEAIYTVCAGASGILFSSYYDALSATGGTSYIYFFDGASPPRRVNEDTTVVDGRISYNSLSDLFSIVDVGFSPGRTFFYCPSTQSWGVTRAPAVVASGARPLMGDYSARLEASAQSTLYEQITAGKIKRWAWAAGASGTSPGTNAACYLETAMVGRADAKTTFSRLTPLLRKRVDLGTESVALRVNFFRELHDTSAASTQAVTESTARARFDFLGTDNFARFKVTFTAWDVEVDDYLIKALPAGAE